MSELTDKAAEFAQHQHRNQTRLDGSSYFGHCRHVADLARAIASAAYIDQQNLNVDICEAAGYCHDTIEDTNCDFDDVSRATNHEVATIVALVSDDKRLPSQWRHDEYVKVLRVSGKGAHIVKLADIIDNVDDALAGKSAKGTSWLRTWTMRSLEILNVLGSVHHLDDFRLCRTKLEAFLKSMEENKPV